MDIPVTTRITERPVWARHLRRVWANTGSLPAPTEEEKHDAILVLSDPLNEALFGLWDEATRIFDEASV